MAICMYLYSCLPLSLLVGYIIWSNVLCLVSCDDADVDIAPRTLGGGERGDGEREGGGGELKGVDLVLKY